MSVPYLGDYAVGQVVDFKWPTNGADGASITRGTNGSIRVYKNNSTTQRSSAAGITDTEDFDTDPLTGVHHLRVDLADNTDAGFYAASNDYQVVLVAAGIDGKTVNTPLFCFSIQNRYHGAVVTADDIALAVLTLADGVETDLTLQDALRAILSTAACKSNGATGGAGTMHFRNPADDKNRVTAVYDSAGNRTSITFDLT